jgi:hypothetical protein
LGNCVVDILPSRSPSILVFFCCPTACFLRRTAITDQDVLLLAARCAARVLCTGRAELGNCATRIFFPTVALAQHSCCCPTVWNTPQDEHPKESRPSQNLFARNLPLRCAALPDVLCMGCWDRTLLVRIFLPGPSRSRSILDFVARRLVSSAGRAITGIKTVAHYLLAACCAALHYCATGCSGWATALLEYSSTLTAFLFCCQTVCFSAVEQCENQDRCANLFARHPSAALRCV